MTNQKIEGRGAQFNPKNRFERLNNLTTGNFVRIRDNQITINF
ncbi:MAG: hypothetical protein ACYCVH_13625 [Ignavibacteriaceae bacterium]